MRAKWQFILTAGGRSLQHSHNIVYPFLRHLFFIPDAGGAALPDQSSQNSENSIFSIFVFCMPFLCLQVEGCFPDTMTRCAELINNYTEVDFVDINSGCPIDLVFKKVNFASKSGQSKIKIIKHVAFP